VVAGDPLAHEIIDRREERGERLPEPVGAAMSIWRPRGSQAEPRLRRGRGLERLHEPAGDGRMNDGKFMGSGYPLSPRWSTTVYADAEWLKNRG
jgi:hypothetical protein